MTEKNITHRVVFNKQSNTVDVYVTVEGTYTIVLEDVLMFDKELDVDEFDEIVKQLLNDEENEDGWVMTNFTKFVETYF